MGSTLGYVPFMVIGLCGTTVGMARIAKRYHLWFHVDAAYDTVRLTGGFVFVLDHTNTLRYNFHFAYCVA